MKLRIAPKSAKLSLLQLAAATYLMSSGGPYGIEELVRATGYPAALAIIVLVPLFWSLPVGLMVGELSAALPAEGGFYYWVTRALGPFWGFQEAWLSLASSIFDMAVYPTVFVASLGRLWPAATQGHNGILIGLLMVWACIAWNLFGARAVGEGSTLSALILLSPFAVIAGISLFSAPGSLAPTPVAATPVTGPIPPVDILAGIVVAMWNYMGWDNASTVAGEVENPQRTYPRVMGLAIAVACGAYLLSIASVWRTGLPTAQWTSGSWVEIATLMGGRGLGIAILSTTMVSMFGAFNSLAMSYSRLPVAMAENGHAPRVMLRKLPNGAPWASLVLCGIAWSAALGVSFERLLLLDILLYGASLILEFAALIRLRIVEPELPRPFRVPGGRTGAILIGVAPLALLIVAAIRSHDDKIGNISAFVVGLGIMGLGILAAGILLRFLCRASSGSASAAD